MIRLVAAIRPAACSIVLRVLIVAVAAKNVRSYVTLTQNPVCAQAKNALLEVVRAKQILGAHALELTASLLPYNKMMIRFIYRFLRH